MSYHPIDDSGEFNDSVVYLHPLKLTENPLALARPNNPPQLNLGIYEDIKLTPLLRQRQGNVLQLVSLDVASRHAFVTEQGEALLRQYASNEVAFVMVGGNRSSGKSFFCDKVLNLCEVRGNHFCRSKNTGINVWSAPFQKDDLKIFLLEINGCSIQSEQFKVLLTYSIMIGSAFIIIDDLLPTDNSALQQFDLKLAQIVDQITPSRLQAEGEPANKRNIFLPEFFYFLRRAAARKENQSFNVVSSFIEQRLPDALASGYKGDAGELIHLPFLDTKCISQEYMRKVGSIFSQVYDVVTEKRYNELNLTGSIVLKIIKYIQSYLNSSQTINIEELYDRIIQDLYQSAYNYCILSYHEEMERHFQNEEPKSIDQLVSIFETASFNVLDKFQEFTLDEKFHQFYREKLQRHIDEKELMILDINKLKTQRTINSAYDPAHLTSYDHWKTLVQKVKAKSLNHGSAEGLASAASDLLQNLGGGVDHAALREIEKLAAAIDSKKATLKSLKEKNEEKSRERGLVNKQQEDMYQSQKRLQNKKKELKAQIQHISGMNHGQPQQLAKEKQRLEETIKRNNTVITDLKKADPKKNKNVFAVESKIQETGRNIAQLEKILSEMKSNPQVPPMGQSAKKEEKRGKPKP